MQGQRARRVYVSKLDSAFSARTTENFMWNEER